MDTQYWCTRWRKGETGFHLPRVHPKLIRFLPTLNLMPGARVFVPLCGKSHDLLYLAQQEFEVYGVEASHVAVEAFFAENGLTYTKSTVGVFDVYQSKNIALFVGDYFHLSAEVLGHIDAIYDRASLVAIPKDLRQAYVAKLFELSSPLTKHLLISLSYDATQLNGPPFSVPEQEIVQLYSARPILRLCAQEIIDVEPKFKAKGLSSLIESAYVIQ